MNRSAVRRPVLAVLAAALLIGALALYGVLIPRVPGRAEKAPRAAAGVPTSVLAPAVPPAGLYLEAVQTHAGGPPDDWMSVYGRPVDADPLAGPRLTAIFHLGSDGLTLPRLSGRRTVFVNAHPARLGRVGDDVWVVWSVWFDADQERDEYAVVGRGLTAAEVVRAARHLVTPEGHRPAIGRGGLPDGFEPLAAGAATAIGESAFAGVGTTLRWSDRRAGRVLELTALGVDDAGALLAYAQVSGERAAIRGGVGLAGVPIDARHADDRARAWREGGTAYMLSGRGVSDAEIDGLVAGLRPADAAALDALRRTVPDYPPERLIRPDLHLVASGRLDGGVWAVARDDAAKRTEDTTILLDTGEWAGGSGSPQPFVDPMVTWLSGVSTGTVVIGAVRPPVASVRITALDSTRIDAPLGPATADGTRWFGVRLAGTSTMPEIVAYDANGLMVSRGAR
jgi:hypothetical protein